MIEKIIDERSIICTVLEIFISKMHTDNTIFISTAFTPGDKIPNIRLKIEPVQ